MIFSGAWYASHTQGVAFPTLGIAAARNDLDSGELLVKTYAATVAAAGTPTSFRLSSLGGCDLSGFSTTCDGAPFDGCTVDAAAGVVTVETTVDSHTFVFHTGFRGGGGGGVAGVDGARL